MNIALVTCAEVPNGIEDDRPLFAELISRGHNVHFCIWNDPFVDWRFFDRVVVRSTWDYHYHIQDFTNWIDKVSMHSILINPKEIFISNFHKNYLSSLAKKEISVTENHYAADMESGELMARELLDRFGKIVMKPVISASAHLTFLIAEPKQILNSLSEILKRSEALIQPFYNSVLTDGEVSLLFFAKNYSHAVLKHSPTDFRVQTQFGGNVSAFAPSTELIWFARGVLEKLNLNIPYARVDILDWKTSPKVSELEMIEPELFLRFAPEAVAVFADVITGPL